MSTQTTGATRMRTTIDPGRLPTERSSLGQRVDDARVLVVDDHEAARKGLERLLRRAGFVVDCAADGALALEAIERAQPDVVITDLAMPVLDGLELCRRIRASHASLPVVVVTASDQVQSAVDAMRAGACDYLTKPIEFDAVLVTLERAFERRAAELERLELHRRTAELYDEARRAVQRRDEVLSIVSHDLRSHLSVVELSAGALVHARVPPEPADVQRSSAAILRAVGRIDRLIEDLLDKERLRNGCVQLARETVHVAELLEDVRELRPLAMQRAVTLDIAPPPDASVSCDRARMGQVLANLVNNALKFSPPRGVVRVFAERDGERLRIAVRDDGPGIPEHARAALFEAFSTSSAGARGSGLGLGLYIAHSIVDAHGGRIVVESQEGVGSTFVVELPL